MKLKLLLIFILSFSLLVVGCDSEPTEIEEITIGYFPNLPHAPGIIGDAEGIFESKFAEKNIDVKVETFPRGSLFMDALATEQIDIGYVGPGPVLNRHFQGDSVTMLSNASIGGNVIVSANDDFKTADDLSNKSISTPGIACSHDIVLRQWMWNNDLAMENRGGNIEHIIQDPANMMGLFEQDEVQAAAVSEPWATLMEKDIDANIMVEWNDMPWDGHMPATVTATRDDFITEHPELVDTFLKAHEESITFINENREESIQLVQKEIKRITDQKLEIDVLESSWDRSEFISDLDSEIIQNLADILYEIDAIDSDNDIEGLIDTRYLN